MILALAAGLVLTLAGSALAGEVTGNGKDTPISGSLFQGPNSACAFSGIQDFDGPDDPRFGPGHVQTPHGEPDFDEYFPPGSASICQWLNNSQYNGHSQRPQQPPPPPEE